MMMNGRVLVACGVLACCGALQMPVSTVRVRQCQRSLSVRGGAGFAAAEAFKTAGVQKVLELGVIASFGASLRGTLDPAPTTKLLLQALVPCVVMSSLSSLKFSLGLGGVLAAGACLVFTQILVGAVVSRAVVRVDGSERRMALRRTAAVQLGTCAPATSVFAFTREFASAAHVGFAALADMPMKAYMLLCLPRALALRGADAGKRAARTASSAAANPFAVVGAFFRALRDPFNAGIVGGLVLAALGKPTSSLGFFGKAVSSLAAAQTPVLFLIIGLKFKLTGAAPALCASLLLARHGLVAFLTSLFLRACLPTAAPASRLAAVLSSQAATSIIAYGQLAKTSDAHPDLGYDMDLAFQIVALSFPLTVLLNTLACLGGSHYVGNLPKIGLAFLAASGAIYAANKNDIDAF